MKSRLLSSFLLGALCTGFSQNVQAQQVTVSPIPQEITWGEKAFDQETIFKITGESAADADAIRVLKENLSIDASGGVEIIIGERGDDAVSAYLDKIPQKKEGYYLKVDADQVIIAGNDSSGTFYGVQTFLQIASQPQVMKAEVTDYPDVADRGTVEGFYGNPWSPADRVSQFEFYGKNKMNVYIYGPKDDPYHRAQWRNPYPEAQAEVLKEQIEAAHRNKVQFVWALHPGNDIQWNSTDSLNVIRKLEQMYDMGVRAFSLFFDDISGEGSKGDKQAQLMNYITDEFISKHPELPPLILCPTQYNRGWSSGDYLSILGSVMNPDVRIMWTGNSVVDMINKSDMDWINAQIKRNAYIWLNYPVSDYCDRHLLMGPTWGNDNNIASQLSGFTSNPMEYAEASKVSLYSIADYCWNMETYDADASWERAIKYLMPAYADEFKMFCQHNVDLGSNYHGLRRIEGESVYFKKVRDEYNAAMAEGYNAESVTAMTAQFDSLVWASDRLLDADTLATANGDTTVNTALLKEITPWLQVMRLIGQRGQNVMQMVTALNEGDSVAFIDLYLDCIAKEQEQNSIRSRNFEGSIKSPNPVVADVAVGPFIKSEISRCIGEYKKKFKYRTDVFPAVLIEDGSYYLKYNGKFLTNSSPNVAGSAPTFVATEDNINPQKQEWIISMDYATERYKIVNAYDQRYLNEKGNFTVSDETNPYESAWHSYNLYRFNGKYAIQNAGSAGDKYWTSNGSRVQPSSNGTQNNDIFIFELVPVDEALREELPMIEETKTYNIISPDDKYLTNNNPSASRVGDRPTFKDKLSVDVLKKQAWTISLDKATNRYNIKSAADKRYVNEKGTFAENATWNPYDAAWHTYLLTEMDGFYAIRNAGESGEKFWTISGENIQQGTNVMKDHFLFKIVEIEGLPSSIGKVEIDNSVTYEVNGCMLKILANSDVESIQLLSLDGKLLRSAENTSTLSLGDINQKMCIISVKTQAGIKTYKLILS